MTGDLRAHCKCDIGSPAVSCSSNWRSRRLLRGFFHRLASASLLPGRVALIREQLPTPASHRMHSDSQEIRYGRYRRASVCGPPTGIQTPLLFIQHGCRTTRLPLSVPEIGPTLSPVRRSPSPVRPGTKVASVSGRAPFETYTYRFSIASALFTAARLYNETLRSELVRGCSFGWAGIPPSIFGLDFLACFCCGPERGLPSGKGILIYGAGDAGRTLLREIRTNSSLHVHVGDSSSTDPNVSLVKQSMLLDGLHFGAKTIGPF